MARIDFQNQVQTLMEEIEFLRRIHDQEVKELEALAARDPADNREYFKNEIALAIRDIRNEYDAIAQQSKQDMESWYKLKVSLESLFKFSNQIQQSQIAISSKFPFLFKI